MTDERPWLTLSEAAEKTGLNKEALRSRARRGLIPSRRSNRGETLVQVDQGLTVNATTDGQSLAVVVTELREEIAELTNHLTKATAELDSLRRELDRTVTEKDQSKAEALAAKDELIAELKQLLADARRPWWRKLLG
jgi:DnaJ-domain-containing protein 1